MFKLGNDIEAVDRFEKLICKPSFFNKVYTEKERIYINSKRNGAQSAAGMYCAKEAVSKALGTGFAGIRPNEIEINHDELGAVYAALTGNAKEKFGDLKLSISISHCAEYATAICIAWAE